ncbi:hypothetical protein KJ937_01645 [Patescibacteria group bacterium]|nr:hypothetical protein [Patescibacteria group bacterium]
MSGNYGWGGNDRSPSYAPRTRYGGGGGNSGGFTRAHSAYDHDDEPDYSRADSLANQAGNPKSVAMTRGASVARSAAGSVACSNVDLSADKAQKTTADNVIIVAADSTASMGEWRDEIYKRLALLFKEAQGLLGESLEILFIGFGDYQACDDPFEVAPLGSGPVLDEYIDALTKKSAGGGNAVESSELTALYVHSLLDTSSAKSVYFFVITDEGFYRDFSERAVGDVLGLDLPAELNPKATFRALKRRMGVYSILPQTDSYRNEDGIQEQWKETLGEENVVPLDDRRRVVDVILGAIAKVTGQYAKFTQALHSRQGGTQFGTVNIQTVHNSLSMVKGAPQAPTTKAGTVSLLNVDPDDVPDDDQ